MELTQGITEAHANVPHHRAERPARGAPFSQNARRTSALDKRVVALGCLSVGLGLARLVAPRQMARLIGADENDSTCRVTLMAVGLRELVCGVGLLTKLRPAAWAWTRFAGDVVDLALLSYVRQRHPLFRKKMSAVGGSLLGVAWADAQTAVELGHAHLDPIADGIFVKQSVTVQNSREHVYSFFRDLENLPRFMSHLDSVVENNGRSRWRAKGPLGSSIEWEAEVVEDRPGERIAWRSLPGADVPNRGLVHFRPGPGGVGTEIAVELSYDPPVGALGAALAKLFGSEPSQQISSDLRRLKQVLETGEVLHSDASVHRGMHPARPAALLPQQTKRVYS